MKDTSIYDCVIVDVGKIQNSAGAITVFESADHVPFDIRRVYYLYDIPSNTERGGHAHRELNQFIIAASGSFDIKIDDGRLKKTITLNQPNIALYLKPGIWRELSNFSSGSICLVLASELYDEHDYIRSYSEFKVIKDGR